MGRIVKEQEEERQNPIHTQSCVTLPLFGFYSKSSRKPKEILSNELPYSELCFKILFLYCNGWLEGSKKIYKDNR